MDPDTLIKAITDNPLTTGLVGTAIAGVVGFFRPIMRALQAALVRRIDQAWTDTDSECTHDDRVRQAADRVLSTTLVPMTRNFVEERVRKVKSEPPAPGSSQPPL